MEIKNYLFGRHGRAEKLYKTLGTSSAYGSNDIEFKPTFEVSDKQDRKISTRIKLEETLKSAVNGFKSVAVKGHFVPKRPYDKGGYSRKLSFRENRCGYLNTEKVIKDVGTLGFAFTGVYIGSFYGGYSALLGGVFGFLVGSMVTDAWVEEPVEASDKEESKDCDD